MTEKTIFCRKLHNLSALYPYIVSEHEIEWQKVRQKFGKIFAEPNRTEPKFRSLPIRDYIGKKVNAVIPLCLYSPMSYEPPERWISFPLVTCRNM